MKTRAVVVGVSNYRLEGFNELPYCRNDITEIRCALVQGLNILASDIIVCG